jgi:hypothetical protein
VADGRQFKPNSLWIWHISNRLCVTIIQSSWSGKIVTTYCVSTCSLTILMLQFAANFFQSVPGARIKLVMSFEQLTYKITAICTVYHVFINGTLPNLTVCAGSKKPSITVFTTITICHYLWFGSCSIDFG